MFAGIYKGAAYKKTQVNSFTDPAEREQLQGAGGSYMTTPHTDASKEKEMSSSGKKLLLVFFNLN